MTLLRLGLVTNFENWNFLNFEVRIFEILRLECFKIWDGIKKAIGNFYEF